MLGLQVVIVEASVSFTTDKKRIDILCRPNPMGGFDMVNETIRLVRNALYYWQGDNFTMYMRFYDDGRVINVNLPGVYKPGIVRWFDETYGDNAGTYALNGDAISFTTASAEGRVEYEGSLTKDGMVLNLQSGINNNRERKLLFKYAEL